MSKIIRVSYIDIFGEYDTSEGLMKLVSTKFKPKTEGSKRRALLRYSITVYSGSQTYSGVLLGEEDAGEGKHALELFVNGECDVNPDYSYQIIDEFDPNAIEKSEQNTSQVQFMIYHKNKDTGLSDLLVTRPLERNLYVSEKNIGISDYEKYRKDMDECLKFLVKSLTETQMKVIQLAEENQHLKEKDKAMTKSLEVITNDAKRIKDEIVDKSVALINEKKTKIRQLLRQLGRSHQEENDGVSGEFSNSFTRQTSNTKIKQETEDVDGKNVQQDEDEEMKDSDTQTKVKLEKEDSLDVNELNEDALMNKQTVDTEEDSDLSEEVDDGNQVSDDKTDEDPDDDDDDNDGATDYSDDD